MVKENKINQQNKDITFNNVPYVGVASIYALVHKSLFLTPAHIMLVLLNIKAVQDALISTGITYEKIYEIEKNLTEYSHKCAVEEEYSWNEIARDIKSVPDGVNFSIAFMDFSRLFYMQYNDRTKKVTLYSYLYAIFNSSTEVKDIFTKYNLAAGSLLRNIKKYEETQEVFPFTLEEYAKDDTKYRPNESDAWNVFAAESNKEASTQFYNGVKDAFNATGGAIIYTDREKILVIGYEEIKRMLKSIDKLDELETVLSMVIKISNTMVENEAKNKPVPFFRNGTDDLHPIESNSSEKNESAPKEPIYMYGNEELLAIVKDVIVRADNPYLLILGESGTGKTCFMNYLRQEIESDRFNTNEMKFLPYVLDIIELNSRSRTRGELERTFKDMIVTLDKKAKTQKKIPLLLIEDLHKAAEGSNNPEVPEVYTLLLNAMPTYKFAIVGTSSYDEYRNTIARKKRFDSRLTIARIEEPNRDDTLTILQKEANKLSSFYKKDYDEAVLPRIYDLANQHIRDRHFPSKGINVLNQTFAHAYIENEKVVDVSSVEKIFERDYKVPSAMLNSNIVEGLTNISKLIRTRVIGQDEAVDILMRYWRLRQYGLSRPNKPIASLLFAGNTGTGKTYLAKEFADIVGYKLIRFDMSEYREGHTISKLIGSPAGYVGHEEGGLLVNAVKANPNCVLLLDEIEKAHRDIYNLLLQIMDNAEITSASGEKVDFQNAVIIMTSNCGAADADRSKSAGFAVTENDTNKTQVKIVQEAINRQFSPEFRGRLNAIVQFNAMNEDMCQQITDKKFKELSDLLLRTRHNFSIDFDKSIKEYVVKKALLSKAGGRSVEKSIDEVTDALLDMSRLDDMAVKVKYAEDKIQLEENLK